MFRMDDDILQDGLEYADELERGIYCPVCGYLVDETDYLLDAGMCRGCAEEMGSVKTDCQCSICGEAVDDYLIDGLCQSCASESR